jgi:hypothetical protein
LPTISALLRRTPRTLDEVLQDPLSFAALTLHDYLVLVHLLTEEPSLDDARGTLEPKEVSAWQEWSTGKSADYAQTILMKAVARRELVIGYDANTNLMDSKGWDRFARSWEQGR